jgi:hypothetical protein
MKWVFVIGLLICAVYGIAQNQIPDETFPGHRDHVSFIYHPPSKALLLIGGFSIVPDSTESDVWKWNGKTWKKIIASGPGSRYFFHGTLNSKDGKIYFFGGTGIGEYEDRRGDLWSFDGAQWLRVPSTDIATRDHHKMVYADHLDGFILYGGVGRDLKPDTTTWILRNGQFTSMNIPGPGVRYHSGMVYDKNRKRAVLYGGGDRPNEHWEFDGVQWTKVNSALNPGVKFHHHMVYDETLKAVVLHGGWINLNVRDPKNYSRPVTWLWDGKEWKKITEDNVFAMAMAYDPNRKSVIAYGYNIGDPKVTRNIGLWELLNGKWNEIQTYGTYDKPGYLKQYLDKQPDDVMAQLVYANELRQSGQYAEAEFMYRKIEKEIPLNYKVVFGLIDVLILQNKFDEVERYISDLEHSGQTRRDVYSRTASSLHGMKQFKLALQYYEKALLMNPVASDYYNLGCAAALKGDTSKAFEALNKAADLGFNSRRSYESDTDLETLRSDVRWNDLLGKLKE